jgi:drug/metabolite transporter (DMT)-like permease
MFDEVMAPIEIAGAAVVIGSCLFIAWREFIRARDRRELADGDAV